MEGLFDQKGKPNDNLTSEEWNAKFTILQHYHVRTRSGSIVEYLNNDGYNEEPYEIFLRSTVINLLNGDKDYCYFLYNIIDLLKIFGALLKSKYDENEKCFEVWI